MKSTVLNAEHELMAEKTHRFDEIFVKFMEKPENFSANKILREINFGVSRSSKSTIFAVFRGLEF